jgi:cyclase
VGTTASRPPIAYACAAEHTQKNRGEEQAIIKRGVIVARIKPGAEEEVARIFGESDETELPHITGVRHRSLFVLDDIYIHLVETDDEFADAVEKVRNHDLFKEISAQLDPYITPYNPETWRSPKDAQAREFYSWDPPAPPAEG